MTYSNVQNTTDTLGIGSRAPDFRLTAVNSNQTYSLAELVADSPAILEFMRGTWCPNFRKRMAELEMLREDIKAGAKLVYIAAEKLGGMWKPEKYFESHPIAYPFLLDEDRAVIKAYGLYHRIAVDALDIAHPATIVVDREARVRYIYKSHTQSDRSPTEEIFKTLEKLKA
jgi:peroxiredoxin